MATPGALVPMAGRWEAVGDALRFVPRLPFAAGTTYVLASRADDDDGPQRWTELARLRRPAADVGRTATVVAIHPSAAEVPENLLRLSVTFSAAMEEGSAADRIHLRDLTGKDISQALLPMPPELWDRARRRLTLLLEPGRIKRGLVPNVALGAPLAQQTEFAAVVDATIRDAGGGALAAGARRTYRVGPPIRSRVDPASWTVSWPTPGTGEPLVVVFDRPLDRALVRRCLAVLGPNGQAVAGRSALDEGDVRWTFLPAEAWSAGDLGLHVDAGLEDLAGNSVRRVFDRDLRLEGDEPLVVDEVVLTPDHAPTG